MEHLDLAGVITTPTNWILPTFEQQDAIYLSNSRQMLEPILEETSEDEDHSQNSWNQYDQTQSFWSSTESETGSVIRIEVNRDPDSISERDFACPAKRARRSDDLLIGNSITLSQQQQQQQQQLQQYLPLPSSQDDTVLLRRYQRPYSLEHSDTNNSLDRFLAFEASCRDSLGSASQQRSSTGSRRFDDFFSDSDSLSYHSLSRSSSLTQFESLERQLLLQEQHASMSSLGASSPSLLSFDGANNANNSEDSGARSGANSGSNSGSNSRRGSQSSLLKRFESADGRLHQTYFELNKLNFEDEDRLLFGASKTNIVEMTIGEVKSDSESSTASSGNSILTASKPSAEDLTDSASTYKTSRNNAISIFQRGGKNSVENLSEDSGYCEPSTLRRTKSKSIPKNFEKFCEEEEEFQQYEKEGKEEADITQNTTTQHSKNSNIIPEHHFSHHNNHRHHHHQPQPQQQQQQQQLHQYDHYPENETYEEDQNFQPKINDATFIVGPSTEETHFDVDVESSSVPTSQTQPGEDTAVSEPQTTSSSSPSSSPPSSAAAWQCYERVKNSPTREMHELRRSMAHSPSPVSSESSSGGSTASSQCSRNSSTPSSSSSASVSTCASAASFTWLPPQLQAANKQCRYPQSQQQQQQQQSLHHHHHHHLRQQQEQQIHQQPLIQRIEPKQTLDDFYSIHRNSLPDIRDALSSEAYFPTYNHRSDLSNINGYVLEHPKVYTDDSDSRSTTSPVGRDSRSDATTDTESTPELKKRSVVVVDGSGDDQGVKEVLSRGAIVVGGGVGRRSGGGVRSTASSVPNELYKLGRKKRSTTAKKSKYQQKKFSAGSENNSSSADGEDEDYLSDNDDDDDDDDDADADDTSCVKIRRSCSWSERREQNEQRCRETEDCSKPLDTQILGYINASYQNLTLLDYSDEKPHTDTANLKRGCGTDNIMEARKGSGDYDGLICKGNFLLDELSEIYDKNASILNDKPLHEPISALTNCSDLEDCEPEVQHVQLTIRKPPARQRNGRKGEATNSLVSDISSPTFSTFGKTFDQDPTCLRTSYAQSLEKCNFDPNEVSHTDLTKIRPIPKRRFQSQAATAKKKNLVSSTPNLNAFDASSDDIEDAIYVSSAHTSMAKLPQSSNQKPLGILLPTGSRSSFGKEVSFCPVVSKYSWQEQSSEELNEAHTPQSPHDEEDSDDELLDNADATVIHNTKENELIAARYKEEHGEEKTSPPTKEQKSQAMKERI